MRTVLPRMHSNEELERIRWVIDNKMKGCECIAWQKHPYIKGDECIYDIGLRKFVGYGSFQSGYIVVPRDKHIRGRIEKYNKQLREGKIDRRLWYRSTEPRLRKRKGKDAPLKKRFVKRTTMFKKRMVKQ